MDFAYFMDIHRSMSFVWLCLGLLSAGLPAQSQDKPPRPLATIAPNTIVGDELATNWNRVVLLATPRIASGDTAKLPEGVRAAVSKLTLAILATVQRAGEGTETESYRLLEVGVAYSAPIHGQLTTISYQSAPKLGAILDFYSRQMLSENEKQLANVKLIVRTSTLAIFDAPTIMLRHGQHKDFATRHLVWIDAKTGKMALLVWLLATDREGRTTVAEKTLRVVAPGIEEDRRIHVDSRNFFLGVPSTRAFALEDLPPGVDIAWTESAAPLAARKAYCEQELNELAASLNQVLSSQ
jgi:hypothetical protein